MEVGLNSLARSEESLQNRKEFKMEWKRGEEMNLRLQGEKQQIKHTDAKGKWCYLDLLFQACSFLRCVNQS